MFLFEREPLEYQLLALRSPVYNRRERRRPTDAYSGESGNPIRMKAATPPGIPAIAPHYHRAVAAFTPEGWPPSSGLGGRIAPDCAYGSQCNTLHLRTLLPTGPFGATNPAQVRLETKVKEEGSRDLTNGFVSSSAIGGNSPAKAQMPR